MQQLGGPSDVVDAGEPAVAIVDSTLLVLVPPSVKDSLVEASKRSQPTAVVPAISISGGMSQSMPASAHRLPSKELIPAGAVVPAIFRQRMFTILARLGCEDIGGSEALL